MMQLIKRKTEQLTTKPTTEGYQLYQNLTRIML